MENIPGWFHDDDVCHRRPDLTGAEGEHGITERVMLQLKNDFVKFKSFDLTVSEGVYLQIGEKKKTFLQQFFLIHRDQSQKPINWVNKYLYIFIKINIIIHIKMQHI